MQRLESHARILTAYDAWDSQCLQVVINLQKEIVPLSWGDGDQDEGTDKCEVEVTDQKGIPFFHRQIPANDDTRSALSENAVKFARLCGDIVRLAQSVLLMLGRCTFTQSPC